MKHPFSFASGKLFIQAFRPYTGQILLLTGFGFLGGILEGIGINVLIPLFSLVTNSPQTSTDAITPFIEKFFAWLQVDVSLVPLLVLISILFIGKSLVQLLATYISIRISADYEKETRQRVFTRSLHASWSFLLTQKLGYLETTIMTDVKYAAVLLQALSGLVITLTGLIVYTVVALSISFWITVIILAIGLLFLLLMRPLMRRSKNTVRKIVDMTKVVAHHINQHLTGMKTVKVMEASSAILEQSKKYFQELRDLKIRILLFHHLGSGFIQPLAIVIICLLFVFTYNKPHFNFAALVAIIYLIQRIFLHVNQMQNTFQKINESTPYLESLMAYESEVIQKTEPSTGNAPFSFLHKLCFRSVSFSYQSELPLLQAVSFCIERGSMVGIIGPSGAGKTTLVDLLLRLFSVDQGSIELDGKNIEFFSLLEWRQHIGYVSQDIFLLNDTIENNIRFYNPQLLSQDIIEAAKAAAMYDFIKSTPQGFATVIGERGVLLSAGQRQRIALARVLARQPDILILDEATSALDNESEAKVQEVINQLKGKITILSIAHRLSTVRKCDTLLVLENGRVQEQGKPEQLLKDKDSYFYKVYNIQEKM